MLVKGEESVDVHVRQAVAIGAHEPVVADVLLEAPDATSGHGIEPGVDDADAPVEPAAVEHLHGAVAQVDNEVALVGDDVPEVFLDHVTAIAAGDEEIPMPVAREERHEVPEDRPSTNLHHRFRPGLRLLGKSRAASAGQDDNHHAQATRGFGIGMMKRPPASA